MANTPPATPPRTAKLELRSPDLSSPETPPVYGPHNPFNYRTELGRELIYRRDRMRVNPVDKWIEANISLCKSMRDSRSITTTLCSEEVVCKIQLDLLPVSLSQRITFGR